jgi:heme a synthase
VKKDTAQLESPWPHRIAILLAIITFPLIWVGGLVTTYKAGMAVPDWPSTYGYNLFLYPISTWVAGPFDLFIEHGHRLLGSLAGLAAILLVVVVWRQDKRVWMRRLALAALGLVIAQGLLGGVRVLLDSRTVAMIHGCVGPAFFSLSVAMVLFTSKGWKNAASNNEYANADSVRSLVVLIPAFAFVQLLLGAQLRHVAATTSPQTFQLFVVFHLVIALVLTLHIGLLNWKTWKCPLRQVSQPARLLGFLILLQMFLGVVTWVVKYSWPGGMGDYFSFAAGHQVIAGGYWQAMLTTAHVATGSLILAVSVAAALQTYRHLRHGAIALSSAPLLLELST